MAAPRRLDGAVAVVTGASTGNGRAIARELALEGAKVVCSDVRPSVHPDAADVEPDAHAATDELIRRDGGDALYVPADVTRMEDLERLADRTAEMFGRLDVWVNNAGIAEAQPIATESVERFERTLAVNVTGTWLGCRAAARVMRAQGTRGRIVNLGSIVGEMGQGDLSAYVASKGAVHAMTRELAVELAPDLINVNAVAPGHITTTAMTRVFRDDSDLAARVAAMYPWPEKGRPRDVARAVAFLASDDAAWVTGIVLPVDGGILAA